SDTASGKECRECLTVFTQNHNTDVTWLVKTLSETSSFQYVTVCCYISHLAEDVWKSLVYESSIVTLHLLCSSWDPLLDLTDLKDFLDYSRAKLGSENLKVVITGVENIHLERQITAWWMTGRYQDCEHLTLSKAEIKSLTEHKINPLSVERRMANKLRHIHHILKEASEKYNKRILELYHGFSRELNDSLGIVSRSTNSDFSWITELLHSDNFKDLGLDVKPFTIDNGLFYSGLYFFAFLYFIKKRGQIDEADAEDMQMIQKYKSHFGKDNMIIVIDNVEDSSDQQKKQILKSYPDIEDLYHNIFLFSHQEKSSEYETLLSALLNINITRPQQAGTLMPIQRNYIPPTQENEKVKPAIPSRQKFAAVTPELRYFYELPEAWHVYCYKQQEV
ncbi:unnamed protein product, partial [Staurois parvus]